MTDHKFDRIADDFLSSGPTVLPDRVFDAAFEEVHRTRQRRVLWGAPWRFPTMNTFAKVAVAAVAVIAVGILGLTSLNPNQGGVGGVPSTVPSPTVAPTATPVPTAIPTSAPTIPPLTGQFTSAIYGFSISYPETWGVRPAVFHWTSGFPDWSASEGDGDLLHDSEQPGSYFLVLASQPLGDRTPAEWEADVWQSVIADDPAAAACQATAAPITIDGVNGIIACDYVLVADGGRGYYIYMNVSSDDPAVANMYDRAWYESVLATMDLRPEDAWPAPP